MWHLEELEEHVQDESDLALQRDLENSPEIERWFFSKIAGVTFCNDDGVCRQEILPRCKFEEPLRMEWERDNPVSDKALKLSRENGEQLGYLNSKLAHEMLQQLQCGERWRVYISGIRGGTEEKPTLGAGIVLVKFRGNTVFPEIPGEFQMKAVLLAIFVALTFSAAFARYKAPIDARLKEVHTVFVAGNNQSVEQARIQMQKDSEKGKGCFTLATNPKDADAVFEIVAEATSAGGLGPTLKGFQMRPSPAVAKNQGSCSISGCEPSHEANYYLRCHYCRANLLCGMRGWKHCSAIARFNQPKPGSYVGGVS